MPRHDPDAPPLHSRRPAALTNRHPPWIKLVGGALWLLAFLILCLATIWAAAALYFDLVPNGFRGAAASVYLVTVATVLFVCRFRWLSLGIGFGLFAGVLGRWWTIQPANDRNWKPEVAKTAWAQVEGDKVTIHNYRNFEYEPGRPPQPRWETKAVDLSQLRGVDLFINFWGSALICHPILSFQFGDGDHVAFSIETRMAKGQTYSPLRGFFKQYGLIYIVAAERDVIRVRTNRNHEDLYLYHTSIAPDRARRLFLAYLKGATRLHDRPEFYNVLTSNCTTNVRVHTAATAAGKPYPWDWRMLLNGTVDQLVYERGGFESRLPFAELKPRSLINAKAQAADRALDFSAKIREGLPAFGP
jgi:Domain of unknown function (DUF4105)